MALLMCTDCQGTVSSNAMTCVHCGNILRKDVPGFLGSILRLFYAVFTIGIVIVAILLLEDVGRYNPGAVFMVPLKRVASIRPHILLP
ncbi:hypothetical protein J2T09_005020 [Neorhizobium huautlense]|uniref:Zinc ribbon domain-containing protein n=1 Tax=Neorhizobium huautlense TaxID=67774 RepID=A0ABT9Q0H6_9HYPH|nr:hypothetical protein [Neorhizobium huautlense]MDP9840236.1 hypothetical protein [Neorhizobium huautlense]